MNKSESIVKISGALVKAQSEMGAATKDSKNPFFKSSYADLNAIREATIPVLNRHGITVLQPMTVVDGKQYIETTLLHDSGEYLTSLTEIVAAKANDPQAAGSAQTYARRYGLQAFLCVGAEDDDGEKAMGRNVTKAPVKDTPKLSDVEKQNLVEQAKAAGVEETPVKKGGFGVKKTETVVTAATEDGWS